MYVLDYLRNRRVCFESFLHCPASSASRLAAQLHIPGQGVAKSVLVKTRGAYVLTILPATSRVDLALLRKLWDTIFGDVRLATAEEIEQIFHDCEPGTIPPFGRLYTLETVIDVSLQNAVVLIFRTNTRHQGVRMRVRDYASLEEPLWADLRGRTAWDQGVRVPVTINAEQAEPESKALPLLPGPDPTPGTRRSGVLRSSF